MYTVHMAIWRSAAMSLVSQFYIVSFVCLFLILQDACYWFNIQKVYKKHQISSVFLVFRFFCLFNEFTLALTVWWWFLFALTSGEGAAEKAFDSFPTSPLLLLHLTFPPEPPPLTFPPNLTSILHLTFYISSYSSSVTFYISSCSYISSYLS